LLRAHNHTCVDYVGPWLPEPIQTTPPGADGELAASLTTAFLLMLERLTPKECAAYLLREIFDQPYPVIAATLEMEEAACRKLVSRARTHIDQGKIRHVTLPGRRRCIPARRRAILALDSYNRKPTPAG
jgi:DNA-directed RNA polymerase specialized sigma24 family protein